MAVLIDQVLRPYAIVPSTGAPVRRKPSRSSGPGTPTRRLPTVADPHFRAQKEMVQPMEGCLRDASQGISPSPAPRYHHNISYTSTTGRPCREKMRPRAGSASRQGGVVGARLPRMAVHGEHEATLRGKWVFVFPTGSGRIPRQEGSPVTALPPAEVGRNAGHTWQRRGRCTPKGTRAGWVPTHGPPAMRRFAHGRARFYYLRSYELDAATEPPSRLAFAAVSAEKHRY